MEGKSAEAKDDDRQCSHCGHRISLVESIMKCRCGHTFCERHRTPEHHGCKFDWIGMQKEKVARENPRVQLRHGCPATCADWQCEYNKYHQVRSRQERQSQMAHCLGFIIFILLSVRGLLVAVFSGQLQSAVQQTLLGYVLGLVAAIKLPTFLGCAPKTCRYCIFSWDVLSGFNALRWAVQAEFEAFKEGLIFCLTNGKQNCLTRKLYEGPRTLKHICSTSVQRLREVT
mmetsp:Transcript_6094/g.13354  ORF Transcript_6094/g.13354 Transcript_6094/m.13354 type:complete len:229 (-) Transcript_6094:197-883(-)